MFLAFYKCWPLLHPTDITSAATAAFPGTVPVITLLQSLKTSGKPRSGFADGSVVKNPPANAGDVSSIPGSRRSPGEGNGNPLHCSHLGNPMDRGAWWVIVHGVAKVRYDLTTKQNKTEVIDELRKRVNCLSLGRLL